MTSESSPYWIHYLPVLTTVVAAAFSTVLFAKWRRQPSPVRIATEAELPVR